MKTMEPPKLNKRLLMLQEEKNLLNDNFELNPSKKKSKVAHKSGEFSSILSQIF